jgi:hypothetical protein
MVFFHLTPQGRENARQAAATSHTSPAPHTITWTPPKYTVSDAFRMFSRRTNGHGWVRIIRAPSFRGTSCWFFLTFLFFTLGIVYVSVLYSNYAQYETGRRCFGDRARSGTVVVDTPSAPPRVGTAVASTDKYDFRSVCRNVYPLHRRQAPLSKCHCLLQQSRQSVQRNQTSHFSLDFSSAHSLLQIVNAQPDSYNQSLRKIPANIDSLFKEQDYYIGKLKVPLTCTVSAQTIGVLGDIYYICSILG